MPKGPNGEKRPADSAQCAHRVFQIAVGEMTDDRPSGRQRSGLAGAKARVANTTSEERQRTAKKAAAARWS
jgi:hypothetical protein